MSSRTAILIPARYQSSRFPGKPLVLLAGEPMIVRVARICEGAVGRDRVHVATDSEQIANVARAHGIQSIMTAPDNLTGTDRVAEAARQVDADIVLNVQGDEPLISPSDVLTIIEAKRRHPEAVICGMAQHDPTMDSVNVPKVVTNEGGVLLYMSRALIPGSKQPSPDTVYYKQVCIYAFTKGELARYAAFGRKSRVEAVEDIEILRFFELGQVVRMVPVEGGGAAVDVPGDVVVVEQLLAARGRARTPAR